MKLPIKALTSLSILLFIVGIKPPWVNAQREPVIAAAGDIACKPGDTEHPCHQAQTSNLVVNDSTITDVTLGDNQYEVGAYDAYLASYDPTWGRFKGITQPVPGNHEWRTTNAAGYRKYFGYGSGRLWYSYNLGAWHIVALDSDCKEIGGCGTGSNEYKFLKNDLTSDTHLCELLYFHHARFSSSSTAAPMGAVWRLAYDNGVDVILNGHEHDYERFAPQTPSGALDLSKGIREFVVGTGGKNHAAFDATLDENSRAHDNTTFGVLKMTLG